MRHFVRSSESKVKHHSDIVVINSGMTMHERDFKASNAWLFPKLGDIAVERFERKDDGSFSESVTWAGIFDCNWQLP